MRRFGVQPCNRAFVLLCNARAQKSGRRAECVVHQLIRELRCANARRTDRTNICALHTRQIKPAANGTLCPQQRSATVASAAGFGTNTRRPRAHNGNHTNWGDHTHQAASYPLHSINSHPFASGRSLALRPSSLPHTDQPNRPPPRQHTTHNVRPPRRPPLLLNCIIIYIDVGAVCAVCITYSTYEHTHKKHPHHTKKTNAQKTTHTHASVSRVDARQHGHNMPTLRCAAPARIAEKSRVRRVHLNGMTARSRVHRAINTLNAAALALASLFLGAPFNVCRTAAPNQLRALTRSEWVFADDVQPQQQQRRQSAACKTGCIAG